MIAATFAMTGLLLGSFLNVVVHRLPAGARS
jgi:prepilin signal peptidase PulO-like enzyme (type II secretory pathway)